MIKSIGKSLHQIFWPLTLALILTACSSNAPQSGKTEAEVLYKQAKDYIEAERYLLAQEKLNSLRSQHPYSYYATHAELMQADILFQQENYGEAAASYLSFRDLHPKHDRMPYVVWMIAESFYKQLPSSHDRDLSTSSESIKYYKDLIALYPDSPYVSDANLRIKVIDEMITQKELHVADFYYRTESFSSARSRYLSILSMPDRFNDETTQSMARERVLLASIQLEEKKECEKYLKDFEASYGLNNPAKFAKMKEECQEIKEN